MSAHRYWRIYVTATGDSYAAFAEIELRESSGGADQTGSGTASASASEGGHPASSAVDNNASTFWGSYSGTLPQWWAYDFGAGVTKNIIELSITARSDAYYYEAPGSFEWQYSDNGVNWFRACARSGYAWTAGETKVIDVLADALGTPAVAMGTPRITAGADPAAADYPAESDVRNGVSYGDGTYTGDVILPGEVDVRSGTGYGSGGTERTGTMKAGGNRCF